MLLFITYFITFVTSEITHFGSVLTLINESVISSANIISYKYSISCHIVSNEAVNITEDAFKDFKSLQNLSISCPKISIRKSSFQDCKQIKFIYFNSTIFDIDNESFLLDLDFIKYQGINFNSISLSFLTNDTKELIIDITGNCSFSATNNYFDNHVKKLIVNANYVTFTEESMKHAMIKEIEINAINSIYINENSLSYCHINDIYLNAGKSIEISQSAFYTPISNSISITSKGTINIGDDSFYKSETGSTYIDAVGDITIGKNVFSSNQCSKIIIKSTESSIRIDNNPFLTSTISNLKIVAQKDISFAYQDDSNQIESKINELSRRNYISTFYVTCNGTASFDHCSFSNDIYIQYFHVNATKEITFGVGSFNSSIFGIFIIYSNGPVTFLQDSFSDCKSMELLSLTTNANVVFISGSFHNSKLQEMSIYYNKNYLKQTAVFGTVNFGKRSFSSCTNLNRIDIRVKGNIFIDENSFEKNSVLSTAFISTDGKLHIGNNAFVNCFSGTKIFVNSTDNDVSYCARGGSCKKRKKFGCSPDHEYDIPKSGSKTLGNIEIRKVYLGISPTIYFNFHFFINMMKNARKILGHIVPPPDFVHSAIWVGESDASDDCIGAIFVYGRYYNRLIDDSFLSFDGARSYTMTLKEFKNRYSVDILKLKPGKKVSLFDFIEKLKVGGKITADDYNWPTNNCQHFTAQCINLLNATREIPHKNDWISLPKPIIKSLISNEKKKKIDNI